MTKINYFFTKQDPNYRIKGSRDPLGFQQIWQRCGKKLIKDLSTVSSNIRDFQVLSFAWYFWDDKDPKRFLPFFLKFEQACGFARGIHFPDEGFNGVDFVNKNKNNKSLTFSIQNQHTLLSNQRTYGVLGKYTRPFRDMKIAEDEDFRQVMETACKRSDYQKLSELINHFIKKDEITIQREELQVFADLLGALTEEEQSFYRRKILEVDDAEHVQNELYHILKNNRSLLEGRFNLQPFIQELLREAISPRLREILIDIKNTEKVLYLYEGIFRTLQTKSVWSDEEIKQHPLFQSIPPAMHYDFSAEDEMQRLNEQLKLEPSELIQNIIKRNGQISKRRNHSAPWMEFNERQRKVQVYYSEGKSALTEFRPEQEYNNSYFIASYLNLFRQIERI